MSLLMHVQRIYAHKKNIHECLCLVSYNDLVCVKIASKDMLRKARLVLLFFLVFLDFSRVSLITKALSQGLCFKLFYWNKTP